MKLIGEIKTSHYTLRIQTDKPLASFHEEESQWVYITKSGNKDYIGRQSIGLGMSRLRPLLQILSKIDADYHGPRQEFTHLDE